MFGDYDMIGKDGRLMFGVMTVIYVLTSRGDRNRTRT